MVVYVCLFHLGDTEVEAHFITGSKNVKGKIPIRLQESLQMDSVMAKNCYKYLENPFSYIFVKATSVAISKTARVHFKYQKDKAMILEAFSYSYLFHNFAPAR